MFTIFLNVHTSISLKLTYLKSFQNVDFSQNDISQHYCFNYYTCTFYKELVS